MRRGWAAKKNIEQTKNEIEDFGPTAIYVAEVPEGAVECVVGPHDYIDVESYVQTTGKVRCLIWEDV